MTWMRGATFALVVGLSPVAATLQPPPLAETVQRYTRGESVADVLPRHVRSDDAFEDLVRNLKREVSTLPPPLAAAFALEAAAVGFREGPAGVRFKPRQGVMAVLEVGCKRLRESSPSPSAFELRWHALAMDLLTRTTRRGNGSAETTYVSQGFYNEHVKHVRERNHSEPSLVVALAR